MDPLFDGDAVNTLHIGSSEHCEFLRATREKRLKSRRSCLNEHPAGNITGILEGMNRFWRHECNATGSQVMRLFVVEERLLTLLDHEEFILVEVAVQRSATGWSALGPQCKLSSCCAPTRWKVTCSPEACNVSPSPETRLTGRDSVVMPEKRLPRMPKFDKPSLRDVEPESVGRQAPWSV